MDLESVWRQTAVVPFWKDAEKKAEKGKKNLKNPEEIINYFEYDEMAYYDELLGANRSPSRIIDLETKAVIRT